MTRAALALLPALALAAALGCGGGDSCGPVECPALAPDAGQQCPNAIASDESCSACLKDHGAGASYCAASCTGDADCAGMSSGWGDVPMVCHPDGYCTRTCTAPADCALGDGVDYSCDDGRCTVCIDCF